MGDLLWSRKCLLSTVKILLLLTMVTQKTVGQVGFPDLEMVNEIPRYGLRSRLDSAYVLAIGDDMKLVIRHGHCPFFKTTRNSMVDINVILHLDPDGVWNIRTGVSYSQVDNVSCAYRVGYNPLDPLYQHFKQLKKEGQPRSEGWYNVKGGVPARGREDLNGSAKIQLYELNSAANADGEDAKDPTDSRKKLKLGITDDATLYIVLGLGFTSVILALVVASYIVWFCGKKKWKMCSQIKMASERHFSFIRTSISIRHVENPELRVQFESEEQKILQHQATVDIEETMTMSPRESVDSLENFVSTGVAFSSSEAKISSDRTSEAAEARKQSSRLLGQMEAVIKTNKVGHKHSRHLDI